MPMMSDTEMLEIALRTRSGRSTPIASMLSDVATPMQRIPAIEKLQLKLCIINRRLAEHRRGFVPAALEAWMPAGASSSTTQCRGCMPTAWAAARKTSGAGFNNSNLSAEMMASKSAAASNPAALRFASTYGKTMHSLLDLG